MLGNGTFVYRDSAQSAELAAGSIARFKGELASDELVEGRTHRPAPPGEGLQERVYTSAFAIGDAQEGVDDDQAIKGRNAGASAFGQPFACLGRHQPYAVCVPTTPDPTRRPRCGSATVVSR